MEDDQQEAIACLAENAVERIDTHSAIIFLTRDRAYKLKRRIRFSYLDYSTLALRQRACEREVELNRRTAPTLYLGAEPIRRGGNGPILDWVVVMRRFDQSLLFDRLAAEAKLTPALLRDLADRIVEFHAAALRHDDFGDLASWHAILADNERNLRLASPPLASREIDDLVAASKAALARHADRLTRRRAAGRVRRCHGDLHLRNICLLEGRPTLFDCIEFSDRIAIIDVLYDIAFLFMDLTMRRMADANALLFNRLLDRTGDSDGLPALPFFMSVRAAIRAHVAMAAARQQPDQDAAQCQTSEARGYFALARQLLRPSRPRLLAVGGLSGSGKSTLAAALASDFAPPPGARVIRSDATRKRLLGLMPEARLPGEAYAASVSGKIYQAMREEARTALAAGYTVILDATFLDAGERSAVAAVARSAKIPFTGLWLDAPATILARRVSERQNDASDADLAVLETQLHRDAGDVEWHHLDAATDRPSCLAAARALFLDPDQGWSR
ncbi:MAG TPA: AAA family ATPase [Stellaceae bacterium]|nr:AAA family ATPase [Stellaceae bacterium]